MIDKIFIWIYKGETPKSFQMVKKTIDFGKTASSNPLVVFIIIFLCLDEKKKE